MKFTSQTTAPAMTQKGPLSGICGASSLTFGCFIIVFFFFLVFVFQMWEREGGRDALKSGTLYLVINGDVRLDGWLRSDYKN